MKLLTDEEFNRRHAEFSDVPLAQYILRKSAGRLTEHDVERWKVIHGYPTWVRDEDVPYHLMAKHR